MQYSRYMTYMRFPFLSSSALIGRIRTTTLTLSSFFDMLTIEGTEIVPVPSQVYVVSNSFLQTWALGIYNSNYYCTTSQEWAKSNPLIGLMIVSIIRNRTCGYGYGRLYIIFLKLKIWKIKNQYRTWVLSQRLPESLSLWNKQNFTVWNKLRVSSEYLSYWKKFSSRHLF